MKRSTISIQVELEAGLVIIHAGDDNICLSLGQTASLEYELKQVVQNLKKVGRYVNEEGVELL